MAFEYRLLPVFAEEFRSDIGQSHRLSRSLLAYLDAQLRR
jgi:hypothetical protein